MIPLGIDDDFRVNLAVRGLMAGIFHERPAENLPILFQAFGIPCVIISFVMSHTNKRKRMLFRIS